MVNTTLLPVNGHHCPRAREASPRRPGCPGVRRARVCDLPSRAIALRVRPAWFSFDVHKIDNVVQNTLTVGWWGPSTYHGVVRHPASAHPLLPSSPSGNMARAVAIALSHSLLSSGGVHARWWITTRTCRRAGRR